jgi:hypothetical protein
MAACKTFFFFFFIFYYYDIIYTSLLVGQESAPAHEQGGELTGSMGSSACCTIALGSATQMKIATYKCRT